MCWDEQIGRHRLTDVEECVGVTVGDSVTIELI